MSLRKCKILQVLPSSTKLLPRTAKYLLSKYLLSTYKYYQSAAKWVLGLVQQMSFLAFLLVTLNSVLVPCVYRTLGIPALLSLGQAGC